MINYFSWRIVLTVWEESWEMGDGMKEGFEEKDEAREGLSSFVHVRDISLNRLLL